MYCETLTDIGHVKIYSLLYGHSRTYTIPLSRRNSGINWQATAHCKKFIAKFTDYLGNFATKTLGKFIKPVCIFRKIGHTVKTNRITFTAKYFGRGVTKINCLNYKRNLKIRQNTVCLIYKIEIIYYVNKLIPLTSFYFFLLS